MSELFAYQAEGADYLAARQRALLCDEPGLGKTAQAIRAAEQVAADSPRPILVIAPASVAANWPLEWARWGRQERTAALARAAGDVAHVPPRGVIAVSYDTAKEQGMRNALRGRRWSVLICDEAHYIKNPTTARARLILGDRADCGADALAACADRVWGLTGTPMANDASELWALFKAFAPEALLASSGWPMSYSSWRGTFCVEVPIHGRRATRIVGTKNGEALRERVKKALLRRRTADVLRDLPPVREADLGLDPTMWQTMLRTTLLSPQTQQQLEEAQALLDREDIDAEALLRGLSSNAEIVSARRVVGALKAAALGPLLAEEMEQHGDKLVVFAWHREAVSVLEAALARFGAVRVDGSTSTPARAEAVQRFQNDPSVRVFIGQIKAAGTGITLTAAPHLVFAEHSWVPADNAQAAKRVFRIGQQRPVLIRHAVLAGTPDHAVIRALQRKTQDIIATIGE